MENMQFAAAIQKERAQSKIAKKRPLKWRANCFQASIRTSSGFETSKRAGAINGGISDRKLLYQEHLLGICFTASRGFGVSPAGKTSLPHILVGEVEANSDCKKVAYGSSRLPMKSILETIA